jgi:hypothetical protein
MKKLLAAVMALALFLTASVPAQAEDILALDSIGFDETAEYLITPEMIAELSEEAGMTDTTFTTNELRFEVVLGSAYAEVEQKTYTDGTGKKGIRVTVEPNPDYGTKDYEVRFRWNFIRAEGSTIWKTEPVTCSVTIARKAPVEGLFEEYAGEEDVLMLDPGIDVVTEDNFAEAAGKMISFSDSVETWCLFVKRVSSSQKGINISFDTDPDEDALELFDTEDVQALNFLSGTAAVASKGTLYVYLDSAALGTADIDGTYYLYTWNGKTLTSLGSASPEETDNGIAFAFPLEAGDLLGSYYISAEKASSSVPKTETPSGSNSSSGETEEENPDTGLPLFF